jgi:hypothetical protein
MITLVNGIEINIADSLLAVIANGEKGGCICCKWINRAISKGKTRLVDFAALAKLGSCWSHRETGALISYWPASKGCPQPLTDDGKWMREGRATSRPAALLRRVLPKKLQAKCPDHVLANFANRVKMDAERPETPSGMSFELWDGSRVQEAYQRCFDDSKLTSCMVDEDEKTAEPIQEFWDLFGDRVRVAVGFLHGKAILRAIVWTMDGGKVMMDRQYYRESIAPSGIEVDLQDWVTGLGITPRSNVWNTKNVTVDGIGDALECVEFYPYLDTLRYSSGDTFSNAENTEEGFWSYQSTSGCREWTEPDEDHEGETYITHGSSAGEWVPDDEAHQIGGRWYHDDDVVMDVDGEYRLAEDCVEINGEWYEQDDDRLCTCHRSGDTVLRDDCYEVEISRHETILIHKDHVTAGDNC